MAAPPGGLLHDDDHEDSGDEDDVKRWMRMVMLILRLIMIIILENNDDEEDNNEGKNNDKEEDDVNAPPDRFAGTADSPLLAPQVPLQRFFINLLELYHHPMQCLAQLLWDNVCGPVLKIQRTELLLQPLLNLVPVNFDKVSF